MNNRHLKIENLDTRRQWRHLLLLSMHGHCCRRHVVGQRVVNDIKCTVICSCRSICSLCCE